MSRSSVIVIGLSVVFALYVLWSARNERTSERHTFSWLAVAAAVAGLAIWRGGIDAIAEAMGIYYAPSALFFVACAGLLWLVFRLSLQVAQQRRQLKRLAQEIAILSASAARADLEGAASRPSTEMDRRAAS